MLLLITGGIAVGVNSLRVNSPSVVRLQPEGASAKPLVPAIANVAERNPTVDSAGAVVTNTDIELAKPTPATPDTTRAQRPHVVLPTITLYNGCGVKQIGERAQRALERKGFSVIEVRNAHHFKYVHSEVLDRAADRLSGKLLADSLGLTTESVIWDTTRGSAGSDVSLIIGGDYRKLNWKL